MPECVQRSIQSPRIHAGRSQAADREDGELDREGKNRKQGDDEGGDTVSHNRHNLHRLVKHAVFAHGRRNAERNGNNKHDKHREQVQQNRIGHRRGDNLGNLLFILGGVAEVSRQHVAHPAKILDRQRLVLAKPFRHLVIKRLVGFRLHAGLAVAEHDRHRIARHGLVNREHQD